MAEMKETTLSDLFIESNDLFAERNAQYGNSFEKYGVVIKAFFPEGVTLKTDDDFKRFGLFNAVVGKLNRYARNFEKGHPDSTKDAGVYLHMLQYIDKETGHGE